MDPINWNTFKAEIQAWATNNILCLEIVQDTDLKFRERIPSTTPTFTPFC
jgi:hypothetical protein